MHACSAMPCPCQLLGNARQRKAMPGDANLIFEHDVLFVHMILALSVALLTMHHCSCICVCVVGRKRITTTTTTTTTTAPHTGHLLLTVRLISSAPRSHTCLYPTTQLPLLISPPTPPNNQLNPSHPTHPTRPTHRARVARLVRVQP